MCPNCGSAHAPHIQTCPGYQSTTWVGIDNQQKCPSCGKRLFGLSIPRLGIHEIGDFCMCVKAGSTLTVSNTRAVYTFVGDGNQEYHVYKHHDGYPTGAAKWIDNAKRLAWPLPRFEPDEFGASFIAANKGGAGGVRLTHHYNNHGDLEYRYVIREEGRDVRVTAFEIVYGEDDAKEGAWKNDWRMIFDGSLSAFTVWANTKSTAEG
jgi:hypothetical protein